MFSHSQSLPLHIQFSLEKKKLSLVSGRNESNPLLLHPLVCTAALALVKIFCSKFETCSLKGCVSCFSFSVGGLDFAALYIWSVSQNECMRLVYKFGFGGFSLASGNLFCPHLLLATVHHMQSGFFSRYTFPGGA